MDREDIVAVIRALADGVDPATGEVFPDNSPYNHPKVIRALYNAFLILERAPSKPLAIRHGRPWTEKEDHQLVQGFRAEQSLTDLAKVHERTRGAIRSRLTKLGELED